MSDLSAEAYRVTAPYATLRIKDAVGGVTVRGFLEGAVIRAVDIEEDSLRHHVEGGMMAPVGGPKPKEPGPVPPDPPKGPEPKTDVKVEESAAKPGPKPRA